MCLYYLTFSLLKIKIRSFTVRQLWFNNFGRKICLPIFYVLYIPWILLWTHVIRIKFDFSYAKSLSQPLSSKFHDVHFPSSIQWIYKLYVTKWAGLQLKYFVNTIWKRCLVYHPHLCLIVLWYREMIYCVLCKFPYSVTLLFVIFSNGHYRICRYHISPRLALFDIQRIHIFLLFHWR